MVRAGRHLPKFIRSTLTDPSAWNSSANAYRIPRDTWLVVALHQGSKCVEKNFRPIQRIHVQLRLVLVALTIRVQNDGRDVKAMPFRANTPAIHEGDSATNHDCANMAVAKNLER